MIPLWFRPVEDFDVMGNFTGVLPPLLWGCDPQLYTEYTVKKVNSCINAETETVLICFDGMWLF
jgi:hypothetical protein